MLRRQLFKAAAGLMATAGVGKIPMVGSLLATDNIPSDIILPTTDQGEWVLDHESWIEGPDDSKVHVVTLRKKTPTFGRVTLNVMVGVKDGKLVHERRTGPSRMNQFRTYYNGELVHNYSVTKLIEYPNNSFMYTFDKKPVSTVA